MQATGSIGSAAPSYVDYGQYQNGYGAIAFSLSRRANVLADGINSIGRSGTMSLSVRLDDSGFGHTLTVIVYMLFENSIEINSAFQVSTDFILNA